MENPDLQGVFGVVPTPLAADGAVDEDGVAALVRHCRDARLHAAVILGSNGEFPYLTFEEKVRVLRAAARAADKKIPLIGCASAFSTAEAIELGRVCRSEGYAAALAALLSYFAPSLDAVKEHCRALAAESKLPIIFYYYPEATGLALSPDELAELAEIPGIHGAKITVLNRGFINRIVKLTRTRMWAVFAGSAFLLRDTLKNGGAGCICPVPLIAPADCLQIYDLMKQGHDSEARKVQDRVLGALPIFNGIDIPVAVNVPYFRAGLMKPYAGPPEHAVSAVSSIKEALRLKGLPISAQVRDPQPQLTPERARLVKKTMEAQGWL